MSRLLIITQKVDADDQLLGFFIAWIAGFAGRFSQVTVLCLHEGRHPDWQNVRVVGLGKDRGLPKAAWVWNLWKHSVVHRGSYDAVFVHMNPIWAVVGSPLWRVLGKRIFLWYTHKAVTLKLRLAILLVHGIFTASKESFRLSSRKVVVTGHGIDTDTFRPDDSIARPAGSLLVVGRIAPVKNLEQLVDAVNILLKDGIQVSVDIVGAPALASDRAYERRLRDRIEHSGYSDRFTFAGMYQHERLVSLYRSHDVFVHLSQTGSLDKTILEAMACGMKVVSCNDASRAFLTANLQFTAGDPQSLAVAITHAMGAQSSSVAREYVVEHHDLGRLIHLLSGQMQKT